MSAEKLQKVDQGCKSFEISLKKLEKMMEESRFRSVRETWILDSAIKEAERKAIKANGTLAEMAFKILKLIEVVEGKPRTDGRANV